MLKLTYKQNRQVQQHIKLRIKYHLSLRHGTNSAVLKKRFHPHWNESSVQMAQAVALQDRTATLLMYTHK